MSSFDLLFWLLIIMLAVVAYAVQAGITVRHRSAVLGTLFSISAAVLYIMIVGEDSTFGRARIVPGINAAAVGLPKVEGKLGEAKELRGQDLLKQQLKDEIERDLPGGPFSDCDTCPVMVAMPPGAFVMGSPASEPGRRETEGPVGVKIDYALGVGRFEVTRDQFAAFVAETNFAYTTGCLVSGRHVRTASWMQPGFEQVGTHPVVCVGWRDARAYVAWIAKKSKKSYRLLSEAEWEYVARAGATTAFVTGDKLTASQANIARQRDGTIPVGFSAANDLGLHDIHGNAWEMVDDCWHADLQLNSGNGRPNLMRADCGQRVIRGGGWDSTAAQSRFAARGVIEAQGAANTVGFRVARGFE